MSRKCGIFLDTLHLISYKKRSCAYPAYPAHLSSLELCGHFFIGVKQQNNIISILLWQRLSN